MKTHLNLTLIGFYFVVAGLIGQPMAMAEAATNSNLPPEAHKLVWPRVFQDEPVTMTMYQPTIEKWDGNSFDARAAVSVQAPGQDAPTFGVIWLTARVDVDKSAGLVTLNDIKLTKASFPPPSDKADLYQEAIRKKLPSYPVLIPLAQIDNKYLLSDAMPKPDSQPVKNDPPNILFSKQSALLVLVDGDPIMRPVEGTDCQRVFNTRALILQAAKGGPYYLRALKYVFTAATLQGPWAVEAKPPANIVQAAKTVLASKQVDPIDPPNGEDKPAPPPVVYVSTTPAELVQTQGDPQFVPIPETQLLEVKNSSNAIILDVASQNYYVLISGRWFSSKAMTGPWAFVDGSALPADFAKIPPDSDKSNVLVSVPNTPQAQEAVLANSIPQTVTIKRKEAKLTVEYGGKPNFKPIEGTPMKYAVNTSLPVIAVAQDKFYCVAKAVWFTASSPKGPWVVATEVAPVIYTIPVSSPLHYVTYVHIYGFTDDVVYEGYTPGYYGTVVSPDGTVVFGTGYSYPVDADSTTYVAQPATYGYGASFADGAVSGFGVGFVVGAATQPYWGCWAWGTPTNTVNVNINNGNIYNGWTGSTVTSSSSSWVGPNGGSGSAHSSTYYNPYTGNWGGNRESSGTGPNGGTYSHNGQASGNEYNGNWSGSGSTSINGANGGQFNSHTTANGNANNGTINSTTTHSGETANGAKSGGVTTDHNGDVNHTGAAYNPNTGNGAVWHDGNVYTDNNGNIYKHSDDGGWQTQSQNGWQNAQRNSSNESQFQNLDKQSQGVQQGSQRFQQQQQRRSQQRGGAGNRSGEGERSGGGALHGRR